MIKLLLFGGTGLVGSRFVKLNKGIFEILAPNTSEVNILNLDQIEKGFEGFNPDAVINFAAYTNVEEAESQRGDKSGSCYQINATGAKNIADICKERGIHLIHISTEYVFDGTKDISPYVEEDKPNPINWYGQTKYFGEQNVLEVGGKLTIVRISMPYSPFYELKKDVARFFLEQLKAKNKITAIEDQRITPTIIDDIASAISLILEKRSLGIYHVCATDSVSPIEFAKTIAETFSLDYSLISSITLEEYNKRKKAKLLKYSWLNPTKFEKEFGDQILHSVEEGLQLFKNQI